MNFCSALLNCGDLDVQVVEDLSNEFDLSYSDIVERAKELSCGSCEALLDINTYIYAAYELVAELIKEDFIEWLKANPKIVEFIEDQVGRDAIEEVENYEPRIYTNYLDSGFDDWTFSEFAYFDADNDESEYWKLVQGIFGLDEDDYVEWLEGQDEDDEEDNN